MSYKQGENRTQINLYPICLDQGIAEDNVVRVIDAFVNWLDLEKLGFQNSSDKLLGSSMYPPGVLLKLYLYGYLNRIRSSRRLELECTRNIELHWLLNRLTPGYHTIADFRKNNSVPLQGVFKEFTQFCIALSLIEGEEVAFDGTKIHAQNNPKNNFNAARLEKLLHRIENKTAQYEQYLKELDEQDQVQSKDYVPYGKSKIDIENTLKLLSERKTKYEGYQKELKTLAENGCSTEDLQISTVDTDARSMVFKNNNTAIGYNVQTVGDAKHSLIVHYEVSNIGDRNALSALAIETKALLGLSEEATYNALADSGYHTGSELAQCAENGIITYVCPIGISNTIAKTAKIASKEKKATYTKDQFIYDAITDTYTCPNKQKLTSNGNWYTRKPSAKRRFEQKYKEYTLACSTCKSCPFSIECQGNRVRWSHGKCISRMEYDDAIQANRARIVSTPSYYQRRKEIIEHPFGTIKRSWGYYYTLVRTKKKVSGEFALIYLCYNLRRVLTVLGANGLKNALKDHFLHFLNPCKELSYFFLFLYQNSLKKQPLSQPFSSCF
jgi:transposase